MRPMTCACGKPGALHPKALFVLCPTHSAEADRVMAKPVRTRLNGKKTRRTMTVPFAPSVPSFREEAVLAGYEERKIKEMAQEKRDKALGIPPAYGFGAGRDRKMGVIGHEFDEED